MFKHTRTLTFFLLQPRILNDFYGMIVTWRFQSQLLYTNFSKSLYFPASTSSIICCVDRIVNLQLYASPSILYSLVISIQLLFSTYTLSTSFFCLRLSKLFFIFVLFSLKNFLSFPCFITYFHHHLRAAHLRYLYVCSFVNSSTFKYQS